MSSHYEIPSWAGKPPEGLHLDVLKDEKLIQKLMIDEKKCYFFGRNAQMNDFCIDHASCSRVHSVLVHHKHLNRSFLIDLDSTHGTFIGHLKLEPNKPTQLPIDSVFRFGASTRHYVLREKPQMGATKPLVDYERINTDDGDQNLLGLPETESDLDNLTEFNTAHNRRISILGVSSTDDHDKLRKKRKKNEVTFQDEEEIINPEDVDPTVGRFRNLVQTTVIPNSPFGQQKRTSRPIASANSHLAMKYTRPAITGLYDDMDKNRSIDYRMLGIYNTSIGLNLPNSAPEISLDVSMDTNNSYGSDGSVGVVNSYSDNEESLEPKKKKYAKEAWPGRKPTPSQSLLV